MRDRTAEDRLDRHALVMGLWAPVLFVAAMCLHLGVTGGGAGWIAGGFGALIAGFIGHVIVNALLRTPFSPGEVALGLTGFAAALMAYLISLLVMADRMAGLLMPLGLGLASLVVAVVVYLVIAHGARRAFETFDVIRDNNPRAASRLPHRGGRR